MTIPKIIKFIFSEKAAKFCEISTVDLTVTTLQTHSLYRLQGSPGVVILPCKDPVKITGYDSNPSSSVVGT